MKTINLLIVSLLFFLPVKGEGFQDILNKADSFLNPYEKDSCLFYFQLAEKEWFKTNEIPDSNLTKLLIGFSTCLFEAGKVEKAIAQLESGVEFIRSKNTPVPPELYIEISAFYSLLDIYPSIVKYGQLAIESILNTPGFDSVDLIRPYNDLGSTYDRFGDVRKAHEYLQKALVLIERHAGDSFIGYSVVLNNLGLTLVRSGEREEGIKLLEKALRVTEVHLGKNHPWYPIRLNNLGIAYSAIGEFEISKKYLLRAAQSTKELYGEDHSKYALRLSNLSDHEYRMERYDKALKLIEEGILIAKETIDTFGLDYLHDFRTRHFLIKSLGGDFPDYCNNLNLLVKHIAFLLDVHFPYMSEGQKLGFIHSLADHQNMIATSILKRYNCPNAEGMFLNLLLAIKKSILTTSNYLNWKQNNLEDTVFVQIYDSLSKLKTELYQNTVSETSKQNAHIQTSIDKLEEILTLTYGTQFGKMRTVSWQQIRDNLKPGQIAIEFFRFQGSFTKLEQSRIGCLVIESGASSPFLYNLFDLDGLTSLLNKPPDKSEITFFNDLYQPGGKGDKLYQIIFQPLETHISKASVIYLSLEDVLHSIAFNAIPLPGSGKPIGFDKKLIFLESTRKIQSGSVSVFPKEVLLLGGIDYDAELPESGSSPKYPTSAVQMRGARDNSIPDRLWKFLPGSLEEVKIIAQLLAQKANVTLLIGTEATEDAFKNLSGKSPGVLHVSTHGFFYPETEKTKSADFTGLESVFRTTSNPLLRSGLLFSGANRGWKTGSTLLDKEDGILTAYEISNLDLSSTGLVVLSACETGLGSNVFGEGIFGLQRAFIMAGVENMIISLWKVPDKQTSELMERFYSKWLKGKPLRSAFLEAQKEMSFKYPPYFWAGFTLTGGGPEEEDNTILSNFPFGGFIIGTVVFLLLLLLGIVIKKKGAKT